MEQGMQREFQPQVHHLSSQFQLIYRGSCREHINESAEYLNLLCAKRS